MIKVTVNYSGRCAEFWMPCSESEMHQCFEQLQALEEHSTSLFIQAVIRPAELAFMSNQLLGQGNTAASIDELYLFLTNLTAIEYIRNASKRVRKKESSVILASQNIEDFLLPSIREMTKPLFSIPTHQFLFNAGQINPKEYMDTDRGEDLLKRSADQGNRYAKYTLGKAYLEGQLLPQNIPEAIRLLTESADSGFAPAQYQLGKLLYQGEVIPQDLDSAIDYLERAAGQDNPYAAYLAGKILLTEDAVKDISRAIKKFEIAAENGNHFAEYQLGKLYLYGREVDRDYDKAIQYLTAAAEHGNPYAQQFLHGIHSNRNWSAAMGSIRLLHYLARMLQNRLEDEQKEKASTIDRKLKRKIDEKKQAHGLKQ